MQRRARGAAVLVAAVLLAATACTDGAQGRAGDGSADAAGATGWAAVPVRRTVVLAGAEVSVDVGPLRVDGERGLLPLRVSVDERAPEDFSFAPGLAFSESITADTGAVVVVDLEHDAVLPPARDAAGRPVGSRENRVLRARDSQELQVRVAAPDDAAVDVLLPVFGLVTDVPVVAGDVPPDRQDVTAARVGVEPFVRAYDSDTSVRTQGAEATFTLGGDVLFATDAHVLSPAAEHVVDQVAAQVAAAGGGGTVTVVGHTDDQGPADYNLDLSRRRAASVAERLGTVLGEGFTLVVDGKGESEPVAEGATEDARAANRRVEIRFDLASRGALLGTGRTVAPPPVGAVGVGHDEVRYAHGRDTWAVRATSVRRRDGYLVGELELTRLTGGRGAAPGLLSPAQRVDLGRGIPDLQSAAGAVDVTLLGTSGWVYPVDYLVPGRDGRRGVLAETNMTHVVDDGQSVPVTVVWPDLGTDTVDIEVQGRFRIADVPVEEG